MNIPNMKTELEQLGVDPCCVTCQHFKTIEKGKLYKCMKQAFRAVDRGTCLERHPWENAARPK